MMAFGLQTYSLLWTDEISEQSLVSTCADTIFNVIAQLSTNARSFTVSGISIAQALLHGLHLW